jgi:hypothetical protein
MWPGEVEEAHRSMGGSRDGVEVGRKRAPGR